MGTMMSLAACEGSVETETGAGGDDVASTTTARNSGAQTSGSKSSASNGGGENTTTSSATSTTTSASSTASTAHTGASVGTGMLSSECQLVAGLVLSNPVLTDAKGDAVWSVGESAYFRVTMTNPTGQDNFNYPGVHVATNDATLTTTGSTLFGIGAGDSIDVEMGIASSAMTAPGDIEITFAVAQLDTACPEVGSVSLVLPIVP